MFQLCFPLHQKEVAKRSLTLSVCSSPLIGAYFFSHTDASSPFQCLFLGTTGIPCPGCGLTRSFMAIAHNNLQEAFHYHLFGPFLFFALFLVCFHLVLELSLRRSVKAFYGRLFFKRNLQFTFVGAILAYHVLRLYALFLSGELTASFEQSPLGKLL